jgi:hypothetical protein
VLSLAACLAVSSVLPADAQRTCGTESPSQAQRDEVARELAGRASASPLTCSGPIVVAFHVLHDGPNGFLAPAVVAAQIQELNANFAAAGYSFVLGQTDYTNNPAWFNLQSGADEVAMKAALAVLPANTLNIYSCMPYGYLGFAYMPYSFPESSFHHGVFIDYRTVPGGGLFPFDLGRTATHEVGHYLGLHHTFEGGCTNPGDEVADTPAEATPTSGCPPGKDTCPAAGLDPIHNYMDYSDDACYTEFSLGQAARMCQMVDAYRPSLITGGPVPARREAWGGLKVRYR